MVPRLESNPLFPLRLRIITVVSFLIGKLEVMRIREMRVALSEMKVAHSELLIFLAVNGGAWPHPAPQGSQTQGGARPVSRVIEVAQGKNSPGA